MWLCKWLAAQPAANHLSLHWQAKAIAHEAYHRGEICVALTESGRRLDDAVLYGQWEWEKR